MSYRTQITLDDADRDRLREIRDYLTYSYGEAPTGVSQLIRYTIAVVCRMQREGQIDKASSILDYGGSARKRGRPRAAP